jgi:predicted kinase
MGVPSSGKTVYSSALTGVKLNLDEIRKAITGSYRVEQETKPLFYKVVFESVRFYLQNNKDVVIDGVFLSVASRAPYIKLSKQYGADVELFWLNPPFEWIKKRLLERNQWVDEDKQITFSYIENMVKKNLEIPTMGEGFLKITQITDVDLI